MKIISVQFDYLGLRKYNILSRVLEYSIKKNCPDADLEMLRINPPGRYPTKRCFAANTLKMQKWIEIMEKTNDDIVFLDCDMLVLQDISDIFNNDFDIGLTVRGNGSIPYNGGVVFAKNTKDAHSFMHLWNETNIELYNDSKKHNYWRNTKGYAGMNQAALGYLLEEKIYKAKVKEFPCSIWNLCRNHWHKINDESRILHIKSGLRKAVFYNSLPVVKIKYANAIAIWTKYANEAGIRTNIDMKTFMIDQQNINKESQIKLKRKRRTFHEKTLGKNYTEIAKTSRKRNRRLK